MGNSQKKMNKEIEYKEKELDGFVHILSPILPSPFYDTLLCDCGVQFLNKIRIKIIMEIVR